MRRLPIFLLFCPLLLLAQTPIATQTTTSIVSQTIAAFSPIPISQVQLSGTAKAYAGSTQPTGTFTATLKSTGESTLQLNLADLSRTETTGAEGAASQCQWTGADSVQHSTAQQNCLLPLHWIIPVLTLQTQFTSLSSSVSETTDQGVSVQQIALNRPAFDTSDAAQRFSQLSLIKLSVDASSFLPTSARFNAHPDNDELIDIPIAVRYSDYRKVSGVMLAFRIQKYINNSLALDMVVESAEVQQ